MTTWIPLSVSDSLTSAEHQDARNLKGGLDGTVSNRLENHPGAADSQLELLRRFGSSICSGRFLLIAMLMPVEG